MSRPRFLADEDLRFEIVAAVRRLEPVIEFATVQEIARSGLTDAEQVEFAQREGLILVSHDVNTLRGLATARVLDGHGVGGVLLTTQSSSTREVAETILMIWGASEASEWVDRVEFIPF